MNCFLCGRPHTDLNPLNDTCKDKVKFYKVHKTCLLEKRCVLFQQRIEELMEENRILIEKNKSILNKSYR